jgi:DNA-binding NtrC family response regulator
MTSSESSLLPMGKEKKKTILCIDDEASCLRFYRLMLEDAGYAVVPCIDPRSALISLSSAMADLVVLDYSMPELDGAKTARAIREIHPGLPIIMISCWPECPRDAEPWIDVYLVKARDFDQLPGNVERLLAARKDAA